MEASWGILEVSWRPVGGHLEVSLDTAERSVAASHIARSWRVWWASTGPVRRRAEVKAELRQMQAAQRPALLAKVRLARRGR